MGNFFSGLIPITQSRIDKLDSKLKKQFTFYECIIEH